jgi:hypothetical protein
MSCIAAFFRNVPLTVWPVIFCLGVFGGIYRAFYIWNKGAGPRYFDAQDFVAYEQGGGRELPVSAKTGTFAPLLDNYIDIIKLQITVAAASIAFGGGQTPAKPILIAKVVLAFSILYGFTFVALLLFYYDEYCQNVRAYTNSQYTLIEALGFSALVCFTCGYFAWAFSLG